MKTTLQYPQCPYCGKKLNPLLAFTIKSEGEYRCTKCRGISNIELRPGVYRLAVGMVLVAAVIFILEELWIRRLVWYLLVLIFVPFLIFYVLAPLFVELKRPVIKRRRMPRRTSENVVGGIAQADSGSVLNGQSEEPTIFAPLPHSAISVPADPEIEKPTIAMEPFPRRRKEIPQVAKGLEMEIGRFGLQKSLREFEKHLGDTAQPVFYRHPGPETALGGSRFYRGPLHRVEEENPHA